MITAVEGVLVGHHTDLEAVTGCTVVLLPEGTTGAVALVGAAPGTRETDVLRPRNLVPHADAFVLAGGSAFGLAAADGVMALLAERGRGVAFGGARVPIVPAAVIFDLSIGAATHPDAATGRAAAEAASRDVEEGSVGAGTGATCAKRTGAERAVKGGLGTASARVGDATVGALVVCNAGGDVIAEDGSPLASARTDDPPVWADLTGQATVIGVVCTDATFDKAVATHVAHMATAGITRAVRPAHTFFDGDTLFLGATGRVEADANTIGAVAAEVVAQALRRGVRTARGLAGVPGLADPVGGG